MRSLLLLSLLLLVAHFSAQMESGDGDQEPEDPPTLCHNPFINVSSENNLIFDNTTDAMQYGQCLSACLAELSVLDSGVKNSFPLTNDNYILMTNDTTDNQQCHILQQQVLECGRGCLISYKVNYNLTHCNNLCFNSCRNSTDHVCYNCVEENKCSVGCSIKLPQATAENNDTSVMIAPFPPTFFPLIVKETDQLGIYSVNVSYYQTEDEEDEEGSVSHSGTLNSLPNFLTLILNITSIGNNSETVVIDKPTLFTVLDLRGLLCQEVHLSYAWINQYGMISSYSRPSIINITGVNISQPQAVPSIGITKNIHYDYRQGYFGHYLVNLSWFNPTDIVSISHYEIHLEHGPFLNHCRKAVYEVLPHFNEARTTYIIKASDPSQPPISRCQYDLKIVSIPVHPSFHSVNTSSFISLPAYPVDKPNLTCSHFLNSKGEYTVTVDLFITDYLAKENIVESVSVIPDLIEYDSQGKLMDQDSGTLVDFPAPENTRRYVFNITQNFQPKSTDNFAYEISVTLDWDYSLVYRPTVHTDKCSFNPISPRPQTMDSPFLLQPVTRLTLSSVRIIASWEVPEDINGFFGSYQLSLSVQTLSPSDDLSQNSQTPTLEIDSINQTVADWSPSFIPAEDLHCMYLQIRVKNTYRPGNWSDPLTIPLDSQCIITSSQLPTTTPSLTAIGNGGQESQVKNVPLTITTSIGGVVLLMITGIVAMLCVHWQLRRRKRRMELIQEDIFRDPIFSLMGPRATHLDNGMEIIQDAWEIPAANVIIECEIGHGEFGEVFKGMITDPTINAHTRKILKDSYSNQVAIKLLKTTATGIERRDFLNEIDLMKQISQGNNSHVVNMIGCVTSQEPLCLITEFVKYGDLLSYLRASRKMAHDDSASVNPYPDLDELQSSDLLSFAYQIASGMEFLSSLDIVHRDLACRNVLVGEGKALKISDYGMSRMVEAGDTYVKTTRGKLPLKWMAIESITDREFTSASDVWAYGVTLWEIGTLGGFPYPTVNNDELLTRLKLGYRMECPDNCSREIYDIMLECWREVPNKRPTFSQLRTKFDNLLSSAQQSNAYIDLRTNEHNDIYTAPSEDEMEEENEKEEEHEEQERKRASIRLSPSPSKKGRSPSYTSISSANSFMMTNPMFLEIERLSRRDESPRLSPNRRINNPQRPTSLAMWDSAGENCYVDEPAIIGNGPGIVIRVSVSTPTSPAH